MATMELSGAPELHEDPDDAHESVDIEQVNAAADNDEQDNAADPAQVRDTM